MRRRRTGPAETHATCVVGRDSITAVLEIRDAQPGDTGDIAAVHVGSWQAAYRGLLPDHILANLSMPDRERTWRNILADPPPRDSGSPQFTAQSPPP